MKGFKLTRLLSLLFIFTLVFAGHATAQVIDFETVPGVGTPTEGLAINTQYQAADGVVFSLESGASPLIAEVGAPTTSFLGPPNSAEPDTPAAGQNIGNYFLTDDGVLGGAVDALIVSYSPPTAAASGVLIDIDFEETFTIEARGVSDNVLQSVTISGGDAGTGDGIATPWSFDLGSAVIFSIRILGINPDGSGVGLGFDNFAARSAAPEPSPALVPTMTEWGMIIFMFLAGLGAVYYLRKHRRAEK
jgi:hypothetical protein